MTRPTFARDTALAYLAKAGVSLDANPVIVLAVRGGLEVVPGVNKLNTFDDPFVLVTADRCDAFHGNTDPSNENVRGRANLKAGAWPMKRGLHHGVAPCFVTATRIMVHRWETEDVPAGTVVTSPTWGRCAGGGDWEETSVGEFAVQNHDAKGVNTTGSEGCQTVRTDEWPEYYADVAKEMADRGVQTFLFVLVERTSVDR